MSYSGSTNNSYVPLYMLGCALILALVAVVGHIANIVQVIIWACGDAPAVTVYSVAKIVACFIPMFGSVMGYVGFFH